MRMKTRSTTSLRPAGLRLLGVLATYAGPATCMDISDRVNEKIKNVRQNLATLMRRGFVGTENSGERVRYFITSEGRIYLGLEAGECEDDLDNFPRPDSSLIVQQAVRTQPTSVFDLARMM